MMIGAALSTRGRPGSTSSRRCRRSWPSWPSTAKGINAHLTAAIADAEASPGGLLMPNQSLLYTGRVLACSQLPTMMHIARELCGGQICVTPDAASLRAPGDASRGWRNSTRSTRMGGRGPPQAAGLRARSPELRLCRPPADVPALRAVAAFRASRGRLPQLRLRRADAHSCSESAGLCRSGFGEAARPGRRGESTAGLRRRTRAATLQKPLQTNIARRHRDMTTHRRIRPFNTRDTYPEQNLDNDLCQAVVAGEHDLPARPGRAGPGHAGIGRRRRRGGADGAGDGEHRHAAARSRRPRSRTSSRSSSI